MGTVVKRKIAEDYGNGKLLYIYVRIVYEIRCQMIRVNQTLALELQYCLAVSHLVKILHEQKPNEVSGLQRVSPLWNRYIGAIGARYYAFRTSNTSAVLD